ncbi:MAG: sulfate transporter CysZ [Arsenophonus sp. NEOnobi-MAG3]
MINSIKSLKTANGFYYFSQGCKLVTRPGIRRFVVLPLLANIILLGNAFLWLYSKLGYWIQTLLSYVPSWMQWLSYLIRPIMLISILLVFSYFFSTIANFIASPFNGWLAEKLEAELTGTAASNTSFIILIIDIPRILARELTKLYYYLIRVIPLLILFFIPGIAQTIAPILWFLFCAWMIAIQYCDYPFDNHKVNFDEMKLALANNRITSIQFGALVNLLTMIPIINLVIMPIAICGATVMWVDLYRLRDDRH